MRTVTNARRSRTSCQFCRVYSTQAQNAGAGKKIVHLHRSFKPFLQVNTDVLLDALEAVFIKIHSPVLCQQKEFGKVLYFIVQENARSSVLFSHLLFVLGVGFWLRMVIE